MSVDRPVGQANVEAHDVTDPTDVFVARDVRRRDRDPASVRCLGINLPSGSIFLSSALDSSPAL